MSVPVIDLFAGPGGLGEGFSRCGLLDFKVVVSIEKDEMAFETLRLRAAHRALKKTPDVGKSTWRLWDKVLAEKPWNVAFEALRTCGSPVIEAACAVALEEAWNLELGADNRKQASDGIRARLSRHMKNGRLPANAVLIGGPPCQAYSIVGRSRNKGTLGYKAENDHRHFLYREYLHVIREFRPAVFVMENVKGILSSKVKERQIFDSIVSDLRRPDLADGSEEGLEYVLVALPLGTKDGNIPSPEDFIVEAEKYGVPQARHRVIILGVRRDVFNRAKVVSKLNPAEEVTVDLVLGDLRRLRPQLSYRGKGMDWQDGFSLPIFGQALRQLRAGDGIRPRVADLMERVKDKLKQEDDPGFGADRYIYSDGQMPQPAWRRKWYRDRPMQLLANHESRAHMPSDLVRYLFVSAYGYEAGDSPKLAQFPRALLPDHENIDPANIDAAIFKDRFRVQIGGNCSMTVTSHISKDGHAFIHPDPYQCRSLTVREAARLQTFPDSYTFLGNRTSQYTQVGNAVPPRLAVQIADVVAGVLKAAQLKR